MTVTMQDLMGALEAIELPDGSKLRCQSLQWNTDGFGAGTVNAFFYLQFAKPKAEPVTSSAPKVEEKPRFTPEDFWAKNEAD